MWHRRSLAQWYCGGVSSPSGPPPGEHLSSSSGLPPLSPVLIFFLFSVIDQPRRVGRNGTVLGGQLNPDCVTEQWLKIPECSEQREPTLAMDGVGLHLKFELHKKVVSMGVEPMTLALTSTCISTTL